MLTNAIAKNFIMIKSVVVFFSLLFLCSCSPKRAVPQKSPNTINTLIPLGFNCTQKRLSSTNILLMRYEGTQSIARTTSFYRRELEAAGWDLSDFSNDQEGLFFCRKGNQECAITVYTKGKTIVTFLFRSKTLAPSREVSDISQINKPLSV